MDIMFESLPSELQTSIFWDFDKTLLNVSMLITKKHRNMWYNNYIQNIYPLAINKNVIKKLIKDNNHVQLYKVFTYRQRYDGTVCFMMKNNNVKYMFISCDRDNNFSLSEDKCRDSMEDIIITQLPHPIWKDISFTIEIDYISLFTLLLNRGIRLEDAKHTILNILYDDINNAEKDYTTSIHILFKLKCQCNIMGLYNFDELPKYYQLTLIGYDDDLNIQTNIQKITTLSDHVRDYILSFTK